MKYLQQFVTTFLNVGGGINASQTTGIVFQSLNNVDATKPSVACLSWADPLDTSVAEWITYTSINSTTNELNGVVRGAEGYSAKTHSNQAVVAFPLSKAHVNEVNDAVLAEHSSAGVHSVAGMISGGSVKDEDDMASNSATALATQQSIKAYNDSIVKTATDGATVTFDLGTGAYRKHNVVLGGNRTLALSNALTGMAFIISLTQDGAGSRTVTWFSTIRWAGGSAPTLTTTLNKRDTFGFICTGSNTYDGYIVGQNL